MEDILRPIYQERASSHDALGVLYLEKNKPISPLTDNFDVILLIIVKEQENSWFVKHYDFNGKKAALHIVQEVQLKEWLALGTNRRVIEWILNSKVLFERNEYVTLLKDQLREFPNTERIKKMGIEFAKLIRRLSDGKDLYKSDQHLDSFNHIVHALHHLARLSVIEQGFHPEVTVWSQVRMIEPEVYKLYHELINSEEPLEKRIELILLASEFSISSKTKGCAKHLLGIISEKDESWSFGELMSHPEVKDYSVDLGAILEHLVEKKLVDVVDIKTKGQDIYHRHYKLMQI